MKTLQMNFLTDTGKHYTFSIQQPKENLTSESVMQVMENIVNAKYFITNAGQPVQVQSAKIVDKVETLLFDLEQ
ncbi:DUF2922 domain-containing protein [Macrococcoides caseolyticum]|uniref:DUF2922 domain-containing protein n=1 Tax=Macrococcoides caseolyticum TaxID=69966 RepID=UPI001F233117|nr:DUF2922 domain-containing protein [Macrococcus caseolyticus]MCE4957155.1 DUF2922 domain-containing protein [Macrococcus caseolyticus]